MKKVTLILPAFLIFFMQINAQQNKIDSLMQALENCKSDTGRVSILNNLSFNYLNTGNNDSALTYGLNSLALAKKINFEEGFGNALMSIGRVKIRMGEYDSAVENLLYAQKVFKKTKNKAKEISVLSNLGWAYSNNGIVDSSIFYYQAAIQLAKNIKDTAVLIRTSTGLAQQLMNKGDYLSGINLLLEMERLALVLNDKSLLSKTYSMLGIVYTQEGRHRDKAWEYYSKALPLITELNDKASIGDLYKNIANFYSANNEFNKSNEYGLKAYDLYKQIGYKQGEYMIFLIIGNNFSRADQPDSALKYYESALKFASEFNDQYSITASYINIGITYYDLGKLKRSKSDLLNARKYLLHGIELAKNNSLREYEKNAYDFLPETYDLLGDLKNAYLASQRFSELQDSLLNEEKLNQINELQVRFETDKKEKEIQLLNKDKEIQSAEIKRQKLIRNSTFGGVGIAAIFSFLLIRSFNKRRKTSFEKQVSEVEMKALRSQMNPHFIFNALQSINDFILKKDTENASNFVIKFAKLMRSVLENSIHKEVSLEKDIASLELYMQLESSRFKHPFEYEIVVDPKIDQEATLIPPLILQPFVENSIWHGLKHKKEKGKIKIEIKEENNSIVCSIEDNGVGREKANILKEPIAEKKESLGMKLTKERLKILEQIKNFRTKIDMIDLKDGMNNPLGFRVELSLPLTTLN